MIRRKGKMTKLLIALAMTVALVAPAAASYQKKVRAQVIPPKKYDHFYPGRVTIRRLDSSSLPCRPNSMSTRCRPSALVGQNELIA
jgi:hypothetical protein